MSYKDVRLVVTIKNNQPIELLELTRSLVALANNFNRYASTHGKSIEDRGAKLYVKEIRSGSIEIELVELVSVAVLPFAENVNTILDFANYLFHAVNFYRSASGNKPPLEPAECKEITSILNPVANDYGSQLNMAVTINGGVIINNVISYEDSLMIQANLEQEYKTLKSGTIADDIEEMVVLTFYQARSDISSKAGNKGIIESISPHPMNIIFGTESIKSEMLHSDINPLKTAYVVDARVETIQGKPSIYRILALHEYFDLDTE